MSITLPDESTRVNVYVAPNGSFDNSAFSSEVSRQIRNHIARHLVWPPPGITIRNYRPHPAVHTSPAFPASGGRTISKGKVFTSQQRMAQHRAKIFEDQFLQEKKRREEAALKKTNAPTTPRVPRSKKLVDAAKRTYLKWLNGFDKKGYARPGISFENHVQLYRLMYSDAQRNAVIGKAAKARASRKVPVSPKSHQKLKTAKDKKSEGVLGWFGL